MMPEWCFDSDLSTIDRECWRLLKEGVVSYKNPFHFGVCTTIDDHFPAARTVIIRGVDIQNKIIKFNTDIRSPKFLQLTINPHISWLFYDENLRIQMRCNAVASLHVDDEIADKGWHEARLSCKITYTPAQSPGTFLEKPYLLDLNQINIPEHELEAARKNFAIVQTQIISLDWVSLHHKGNRRAFFDYKKNIQTWMQS
jgi:pyridoxamine 5'-phosphate oxidase